MYVQSYIEPVRCKTLPTPSSSPRWTQTLRTNAEKLWSGEQRYNQVDKTKNSFNTLDYS